MFCFRLLVILEYFIIISGHIIPGENLNNSDENVVAFILDGSFSILDTDWARMKSTLEEIILRLPNNSKILVEVFSTSSETVLPLTTLTKSRTNIQTTLSALEHPKVAGTHLEIAIIKIALFLNQFEDKIKKFVIILTDGNTRDNPMQYYSLLKSVPSTTIFCFGFGQVKMETLYLLASPGCAFNQANLKEAFNKITKLLNAEFYDKVDIQADFQALGFSILDPKAVLRFELRIHNLNLFESIPAKTKLEIFEISRDPSEPFFGRKEEIIEKEIKPNEEVAIPLVLPNMFKSLYNIPQYIGISLTDSKERKRNYAFELEASLFSRDLLASIKVLSEPLNVLLIGPVGSGKTTLITTLSTVLADEKRLVPIGALVCGGSQHCTTEKKSYNMSQLHKKDLKINFIDTIGIEKECLLIGEQKECKNYEPGFVTALIRGYIKEHENSTVFPLEEKVIAPRAHVVIFVVSQRVYALGEDEKKDFGERIRSLIDEVKLSRRTPIYAITHWDEAEKLNPTTREQIKNNIRNFLNSGPHNTFTIGTSFSNDGHLSFETQIQALQILTKIVNEGKAFLKKFPIKDEL